MKNNGTVYLAGKIAGCDDEEAKGWREKAKSLLNKSCLDPMDRDYRGIENANFIDIVEDDLKDIKKSSVLLVRAETPSWGTAMEIVYAYGLNKPIIVFTGTDDGSIGPWLKYHSTRSFKLLSEAIDYINGQDDAGENYYAKR